MLYCLRAQLFLDGNKRTAMLAANHEMIINGGGIISIPIARQSEFKVLLVDYYETGDASKIKQFILDKCITRISDAGA